MENMQLYIVLAITAFMIISFVVGKIPYGVTTMTQKLSPDSATRQPF